MTDLAKFKAFAREMGIEIDVVAQTDMEKGKRVRWLELTLGSAYDDVFCFTSNGNHTGVKHYDPYVARSKQKKTCFSPRINFDTGLFK